jgi:cyclophilin family peptidyl-prolyl cis-trans isomerase
MLKRLLLSGLFLASTAAFAATPAATKPAAQSKPAHATAKSTEAAKPAESSHADNPKVLLHTSMGDITVELFSDKAPKSVENFLQYTKEGFYNNTVFHRVIDNFMVQGGGFTKDLQQKRTHAAIHNEANNGLSNLRGTLAMARTNDPHSATAQFFINVVDNKRLDFTSDKDGLTWGYCVFGKVISGMDVVDKMKAVPTAPQGPLPKDVPTTPIVLEKAELVQ